MAASDKAKPATAGSSGAIADAHCELIVQREDGRWAIGLADDAPGPFESRRFAEAVSIAKAEKPAPAPLATPRHFVLIREVRGRA
jgi:hypothetical protein